MPKLARHGDHRTAAKALQTLKLALEVARLDAPSVEFAVLIAQDATIGVRWWAEIRANGYVRMAAMGTSPDGALCKLADDVAVGKRLGTIGDTFRRTNQPLVPDER